MSIKSFSESFVWKNQGVIIPITAIGVPLAIETGFFLKKVFQDPGIIKRKLIELKNDIYFAFHQRENESEQDFLKRRKRNIVISVIAAVCIAGAVACPFLILPTAFAIPAALSAAYAVGKLFLTIQRNPNLFRKVKEFVTDAFKQRENESLKDFQARRWQAIKRIALYSLIFATAVTAIVVAPFISMSLSHASSVWAAADIIPFQTKGVVFAEYLLLGAMHAVQAARYWMKGDKARAAFHATGALASIYFPFFYMFTPGHGMRLHHSFIGLTLMLAPSAPVRTFGAFIALDSSLYAFADKRGGVNACGKFKEHDYMNSIYADLPMVLQALVSLSLLQKGLDFLSEDDPKKKKIEIEQAPKSHQRITNKSLEETSPLTL